MCYWTNFLPHRWHIIKTLAEYYIILYSTFILIKYTTDQIAAEHATMKSLPKQIGVH